MTYAIQPNIIVQRDTSVTVAIVAAAVVRAMASACVFLGALGCFKAIFSIVSLTLRKSK